MFFLGGMTMGYLHPPAKAEEGTKASASIPAEKDRRLIETSNSPHQESAIERSVLWAWRTIC
jgi:hypothetical protein